MCVGSHAAPRTAEEGILIFVAVQVSSLACAEATPTPQIRRRATSVEFSFLLELITRLPCVAMWALR
jgi:hypothetical protein